jgi:type 1 glutamine amidotransferase
MARTLGVAMLAALALMVPAPRENVGAAARRPAAAAIPVMILDGESAGPYHDWQRTTPVLKRILDETGLMATTVVTAPPAGRDFSTFAPAWSTFKAVVMNYDAPDERWPAALKMSFEEYVHNGGGLVIVHAADNAFSGWAAYNEMIGIGGWRSRTQQAGPYWFVRNGSVTSEATSGPTGSHGRRVPFQIAVRERAHPITRGLPALWMHQGDELYARLRGPGHNMTVLAAAYSDPDNNGTGRDEPMLLTIAFGNGRVFHTTLGHDVNAMSSVDFVVTLQRGAEWAATGQVTQTVPMTFPTANSVSYRADLAAMDPSFRNGLDPLTPPRR